MEVREFVEKTLTPYHYNFTNFNKIYSLIIHLCQIMDDDLNQVFKNFFPFFGDETALKTHGKGLNIPNYTWDTTEELREKATLAYFTQERIGERKTLIDILEEKFPGRYQIVEFPKDSYRMGISRLGQNRWGGYPVLHIRLTQPVSPTEIQQLQDFLDKFLDPDIQFNIVRIKE